MRATVTAGVKSNSWLPSTMASNPTWLKRSIMCAPWSNDDSRDGEIVSPPLVTSTWEALSRTALTTVARRATPPRSPDPSRRSRSLTCTIVRVAGSAAAGAAHRAVASAAAASAAPPNRRGSRRFIIRSLCRRAAAPVHNSARGRMSLNAGRTPRWPASSLESLYAGRREPVNIATMPRGGSRGDFDRSFERGIEGTGGSQERSA